MLLDHGYLTLIKSASGSGALRCLDAQAVLAYRTAHPVHAVNGVGPSCTLLQAASYLGCDWRTIPRLVAARILATAPLHGRATQVRADLASLPAFADQGKFAHRVDRIKKAVVNADS